MDANERGPHRAHSVDEFHEDENIHRTDWSTWPPDLNPIEYVLDGFGRAISESSPLPRTNQEFKVEKSATKTFQILTEGYGDKSLSRAHRFEWYKQSSGCRVSVEDDEPAGCTSDEAHFWLNGYVNKQNYHIWSEANPQVYVETPLHPEKLTVWCALWAGGILLQKR
ncbi:hypothetical protein TNCV_1228431 [Trichonephila clavipes]|nr:hypothetical protein TNCV_1228431 [Trichonephila clavipes]